MSDGTIGNVKRMVTDKKAPTAPLDEFLSAYNDDPNWWLLISNRHRRELFDEAVGRIEELETK